MLVRSLTVGLLAACLWSLLILVQRPEAHHWCTAPRAPAPAPVAKVANPITIIDLAAPASLDRSFRDIAEMVRLGPYEAIVAINDVPVVVSWACGAAPHYCDGIVLPGARWFPGLRAGAVPNAYVDFTVASTATPSRRVLVLLH